MIKGIGVDICDLRRLKHLDQLAKKILHVDEFSLYLSKDNDKAKEYLDAAMKEMGVSNPADIKITLLTTDTDGAKKQAEVLQEQYQKNLGIKVSITTLDMRTLNMISFLKILRQRQMLRQDRICCSRQKRYSLKKIPLLYRFSYVETSI